MMLRRRQRKFVDNCNAALRAKGNTIGVAPTGAGKTIMLAAVGLENKPKTLPSLFLQHRDELVTQNRDKFINYAGIRNIRRPMTIDASSKAWDRSAGGWNFAMVQTLDRNLDSMPPLGFLGIDEAHHAAADSYMRIVGRARALNPEILIYGTTATPNRGDRRALRTVFDNCGDHIQIGELIREGHLVRPRTFVIDIGIGEELSRLRRTAIDFDMKQVESIMNKSVLNEKIIEHWLDKKCGNRQTIIFCSTLKHAADVTQSFCQHGIKAEMIEGKLSLTDRRDMLKRYDRAETQVLVNVSVLTEGFDNQPTSCVILLRPSSWKSTMVQMIGRGLRKVDPELYPGIIKDDCIILDFGTSCLLHGSLEDEPDLYGRGTKMCPSCHSDMPQSCKECIICGHDFPISLLITSGGAKGPRTEGEEETLLENFVMSEIDILQDSPFKYESFYDGRVMICFGFNYWASVVHFKNQRFYAIGAQRTEDGANKKFDLHILNSSDSYLMALQSADDYMRTRGNKTDARKVAQWLYEPATTRQLETLDAGQSLGMTKYRAACGIQFKFYGNQIRSAIEESIHASEEKQKGFA